MAIETSFPCIHKPYENEGGGGGCFLERGACLTFWPRGWVLSQGRVLLERGGLFERGGRAFTGEGYLFEILA